MAEHQPAPFPEWHVAENTTMVIHLRVVGTVLASKVFPDSAAVKPMAGLLQQA